MYLSQELSPPRVRLLPVRGNLYLAWRFANDRIFVVLDHFDYDLFWKSKNGEWVDADVTCYVAFGFSFCLSFIGSGKVRVRLAGFAHLAAGPFGRTGCFLSPERRDG